MLRLCFSTAALPRTHKGQVQNSIELQPLRLAACPTSRCARAVLHPPHLVLYRLADAGQHVAYRGQLSLTLLQQGLTLVRPVAQTRGWQGDGWCVCACLSVFCEQV